MYVKNNVRKYFRTQWFWRNKKLAKVEPHCSIVRFVKIVSAVRKNLVPEKLHDSPSNFVSKVYRSDFEILSELFEAQYKFQSMILNDFND